MKVIKRNEAIKFLLDSGLLFEINRAVLHPLGLAFAVKIDEKTGEADFDGLWDGRDEDEGIVFTDEVLEAGTTKYFKYLEDEGFERFQKRYEKLGFVCQEKRHEEVVVKDPKEFKEKLFGATPEEKPKDPPQES